MKNLKKYFIIAVSLIAAAISLSCNYQSGRNTNIDSSSVLDGATDEVENMNVFDENEANKTKLTGELRDSIKQYLYSQVKMADSVAALTPCKDRRIARLEEEVSQLFLEKFNIEQNLRQLLQSDSINMDDIWDDDDFRAWIALKMAKPMQNIKFNIDDDKVYIIATCQVLTGRDRSVISWSESSNQSYMFFNLDNGRIFDKKFKTSPPSGVVDAPEKDGLPVLESAFYPTGRAPHVGASEMVLRIKNGHIEKAITFGYPTAENWEYRNRDYLILKPEYMKH